MKTIDELEYYCKETEPVGALMLTGEWGSGKTFLLLTKNIAEPMRIVIMLLVSLVLTILL